MTKGCCAKQHRGHCKKVKDNLDSVFACAKAYISVLYYSTRERALPRAGPVKRRSSCREKMFQ